MNRRSRPPSGFTRGDLAALMATVALLAGLVLGSAAATRGSAELELCRANFKQLAQGWQAFAMDHSDRFIGTPSSGNQGGPDFDTDFWATGFLTWDNSPSNTNRSFVQMPAFVPYIGTDFRIFHCPSDRYATAFQRQRGWSGRIRSYSMNYYFGPGNPGEFQTSLRRFQRSADVPDPAKFFVFVEEHPDSINDPSFITSFDTTGWVDLPASFHDGAVNVAFADAHVETHRWLSAKTKAPVRFNFLGFQVPPNDPDFRWLMDRTSKRP